MAAPAIGLRPRVAPTQSAAVDPSHPMSAGLAAYFVPARIGSLLVASGSANYALAAGALGQTASRISETGGYQYLLAPSMASTGAATASQTIWAWYTAGDLGGSRVIAALNTVKMNMKTFGPGTFGATKVAVADVASSTITRTFNVPALAVVSFSASTGRFTLYYGMLGGALQCETPANSSGLSSSVSDGRLYLGSASSGEGLGAGAQIHAAGAYNRAITADEAAALFADPFQMMRR